LSHPEFLYRYRSASTSFFEEEIRRAFNMREIYCSPISNMNDPLDSNPVMETSSLKDVNDLIQRYQLPIISEKTLEKYGRSQESNEAIRKASTLETAQELVKLSGIFVKAFRSYEMISSLSEVWDSTLMWSHYTAGHKGLCIKYRVVPSKSAKMLEHPRPVKYVKTRSTLTTIDMINALMADRIRDKITNSAFEKTVSSMVFEKSSDWKYEKEWRVAVSKNEPPKYYNILPLEPVGVILGANATEEIEQKVRDIVPKHAEIIRLKIDAKSYKLVIDD
jgi:hypothetical protein